MDRSQDEKTPQKKKIDLVAIQRYMSSQAIKDFDNFLDMLPVRAGHTALVCAGIAWLVAGASVLFAVTETNQLNQMKMEKLAVEALVPKVPKVVNRPVDREELDKFLMQIQSEYSKITFKANKSGTVSITSPNTGGYLELRRMLDHLQYGGNNWRVDIEKMCIGRECKGPQIAVDAIVSQVRVVD